MYLSLIGVWFAIPSGTLLLQKDNRWVYPVIVLSILVTLLFISYRLQWSVLFPRTATETCPCGTTNAEDQGYNV
jgi:hypothetical protein